MKRASDPGSSGLFDVVRETIRRNEEPSEGAELPDVRAHPGPEERFKRGEVLGEGGEGKIYAALDELLGREVAVKVLSEEGSPARARGLREARALSRLDHPSIVPVHDLVAREDGSATLVMKLVRGRNLTDVLSQVHDRPPPPAVLFDIVTIVVRLAEALAHAHELGVLHLDIKPANIMVGGYGEVHLMDWGASLGPDPAEWGPPMLGTPGFMAPEQLWDEPNHVDHRADVYGLGAVLFFALEGREPEDISQWRLPSYLSGLERIVRGALEPDRDRRTASVDELRRQLMEFQRGEAPVHPRDYPAGTWILREREPGHEAYLIDRGRCEVIRERGDEHQVIRIMEPGEIFGELSLFGDGRRTASVRALDDVRVQVLDHRTVMSELAGGRPWLRALVEGLAQRLRSSEADPDDFF